MMLRALLVVVALALLALAFAVAWQAGPGY